MTAPLPVLRSPLLSAVLPAVLTAVLAAPAAGADFGALKPEGYVSDFARVIDPAMKQELEAYCGRVQAATGAQLALVTLPTLQGEPIEDVANLLYRKWGVGQKGTNEGALILLAVRDRRSRVEVGYGLEQYIPDGFAGQVLRDMRPALRQGDYGAALAEAAREIAERVAARKGVSIGERAPRRSVQPPSEPFPWPALVAGIVILMFVIGRGSSRRGGPRGGRGAGDFLTGMIIGSILSGSMRRGGGGGGFGGYDSGDSFGGFGGGDSGGGGASSDW